MIARLALCAALLAAAPARAEEPGPYPDYPAFHPGEGMHADQAWYSLVVLDELETAPIESDVPAAVEGFWRLGNSYHALWLDLEAEGDLADGDGELEAQALYGRVVTAYFDARAGVRVDTRLEDDDVDARPHLVLGMEGLAPYWFEIEPAIFVSIEGDVSARFEASYDLLITQRLVFTPDLEINAAVQEVDDWGVGSGLNDLELGARLRYEITRELAPYLGVDWERKFFETADLARAGGEPASDFRLVVGARLWL